MRRLKPLSDFRSQPGTGNEKNITNSDGFKWMEKIQDIKVEKRVLQRVWPNKGHHVRCIGKQWLFCRYQGHHGGIGRKLKTSEVRVIVKM